MRGCSGDGARDGQEEVLADDEDAEDLWQERDGSDSDSVSASEDLGGERDGNEVEEHREVRDWGHESEVARLVADVKI